MSTNTMVLEKELLELDEENNIGFVYGFSERREISAKWNGRNLISNSVEILNHFECLSVYNPNLKPETENVDFLSTLSKYKIFKYSPDRPIKIGMITKGKFKDIYADNDFNIDEDYIIKFKPKKATKVKVKFKSKGVFKNIYEN